MAVLGKRRNLGKTTVRLTIQIVAAMIWAATPVLATSAASYAQENMKEVKHVNIHGAVNAVAWNSSGDQVGVLSNYGVNISVISSENWRIGNNFERDSGSYAGNSLSFINNNLLITSSPRVDPENPTSLIAWDAQSGNSSGYFPAKDSQLDIANLHLRPALLFASSSDGTLIAAANGATSRDIMIYDGFTRKLIRVIKIALPLREAGYPQSLAISPDKKRLAIGTGQGMVLIFELASGNLANSFTAYPGGEFSCSAIAYSPDGQFIATGRYKNINITHSNTISADIWRQDTGFHVNGLEGETIQSGQNRETTPVSSLSWAAAGDKLAIGDRVSTRVWAHVATAPRLLLSINMNIAYSVSFSRDGMLAVGASDGVFIFK